MQRIPGRRGHVFPWSDDLLAVATNNRGPKAKAITRLPGVTVVNDADDGFNITFPSSLLPQVARLIGLRRKRQLTAKQRQAAAERLAEHRFSPASQGHSEESTLAV
jgi:hypothetical protein